MSYWKLYYHIVWATKDRLPLISPGIEVRLHNALAAKGVDLGAVIYAVGGIEDHLHIAAAIPPSVAVSDFVRQLKGSSSHFVSNELSLEFKWQNEFGVVSLVRKILRWS